TAQRVAQSPPNANLLPAEFATRYHQQFVDRLWMRSLLAVAAVYLSGVAIYLTALAVANYRASAVVEQVASLGPSYTNAIQLKKKVDILKERQELKFAGLDCWRAVAELMPETLTLESCNFNDGKRLTLNGTVPREEIQKVYDFAGDMRKYAVPSRNDQPLFDPSRSDPPTFQQFGKDMNWKLILELKRSETR